MRALIAAATAVAASLTISQFAWSQSKGSEGRMDHIAMMQQCAEECERCAKAGREMITHAHHGG